MSSPRNVLRLLTPLALFALAAAGPLRAEPASRIQPLDKLTVAVTDLTAAGRELPIPSPAQPVYYIGINAGFRAYTGIVMGGDPPPEEKPMLRIIAQVLAGQGFRAADDKHPATQIIVCSWGIIGTSGPNLFGPGPGVHFLGGDKLGLIDENIIPGHISWGDVLRQRFRSGTADTVLGMTQGNLYAVLLRSYDLQAAQNGKRIQLWETRIACASPGTTLAKALPRIVVSGQHVIGRETALPVVENAARTRQAWVEIGESTVVEYINLADLAKAKETAREQQRQKAATPESATPAPAQPAK